MSAFKVEQRRLNVHDRGFHFVSYEGTPANPAKQIAATAPSWFLMCEGKRRRVMPHQAGQDPTELDRLLTEWLETNVFC
jgi:hypothetical protein